jgi:hypothetical protein
MRRRPPSRSQLSDRTISRGTSSEAQNFDGTSTGHRPPRVTLVTLPIPFVSVTRVTTMHALTLLGVDCLTALDLLYVYAAPPAALPHVFSAFPLLDGPDY